MKINEVMEMPPMVRRVQRKVQKYNRLLTERQARVNRRQQALTQKAQPRIQHIQNLQGQIATREQNRDALIQTKANLIGEIQGSRFPRIHMIKRAKARILQVRINSKNRQIARRNKRVARQERIANRHLTNAQAHAGVIPILEDNRQSILFPGLQMGQTPPGFVPAPPPAPPGQTPGPGNPGRRPRRRGRGRGRGGGQPAPQGGGQQGQPAAHP